MISSGGGLRGAQVEFIGMILTQDASESKTADGPFD